jgi:hypothetical protein
VSLAITDVSANVTIQSGTRIVFRPNPRPSQRITIPFQSSPAALATVEIAQVAEGPSRLASVEIATGGKEPGTLFRCTVSAQAVVSPLRYTGG